MAASFYIIATLAIAAPLLTTVSGQTACLDATSSTTTFIVNPTSCQAWIACQSGKVVNTGTCASGYLFNNATGVCAPSDTVTCSTSDIENICVGQTDGSYIANPDNCKSYFYCSSNVGYAGLCNSGYYFNGTLKDCEYNPSYTCPTTTAASTSVSCADVPDGTFLPSNASCSAYWVCENGQPIAGSCNTSIPLYFNALTGACDYASNVECSGVTQTTISVPYNYTAICGTTNSTAHFASDPANCTGYFYCSSSSDTAPSHSYCPDGLYFNATIQECASPSSVTCTIEPCVNQPVGYFATSEDGCADYYYCSASGKQSGSCTTGYYFDVANQDCNSPSMVQCTITTTAATTATTASGDSTTASGSSTASGASTTSTASGASTTSTASSSTDSSTASSSTTASSTTSSSTSDSTTLSSTTASTTTTTS